MANVKFEFSDMAHPTAEDETGSEVWTYAPAFYEAELHWLLGHTPDYIECYFHAADQRQFPWTRARATDENGIVGIWRFDTVEEQFEEGQRVWKAVGRCVLYGAIDNYMRSPRIKADQAVIEENPDLDDDPYYTEWPILSPKKLVTLEDLEYRYDENHYRRVYCKTLINETGCGGAHSPCDTIGTEQQNCAAGKHTHSGFPYCHNENTEHGNYSNQESTYKNKFTSACVYDRNSDRDDFLLNNFLESRYNVEQTKLGPNYAWKGVRRGWVFKDIMRHSSGTHGAASRPILAVYNRSAAEEQGDPIAGEGEPIRSNFQQSQAAGVGANALAHDIAVSWPWIGSSTPDSGYDYRTVWPGKADAYAPSGQAIEIFRRGSQEWDDDQCFGLDYKQPDQIETKLNVTQVDVSGSWLYTGLHAMIHSFAPGTCDVTGFVRFNLPGTANRSATNSYYDLTGIPTPAEVCALVPSAPPLFSGAPIKPPPCDSAYVSNVCSVGGVILHNDCHIRQADTATLTGIYVDIYIGTLSDKDCYGNEPDYYEDIVGFSDCPAGCGVPTIYYSINIPNSCCFWDNYPDGVSCAVTSEELLANPALCDNLKIEDITPGEECANPIIGFEVSVNAKDVYSRARAFGMGMNNPGSEYTSFLPGSETTWNPEQNQFLIRRELLVNDYGINEGQELLNLSQAYLTLPDKEFGGFTTLRMWLGGIPRAGASAPHPNRIIQAGDRLMIGAGMPNVGAGAWIADEVHYEFPKGILMLLLSQQPAAQASRTRGTSGNIRNLGETIANEYGVWESPWFQVFDSEFLLDPNLADPLKFYDTFKMEHYLGVIPRIYLVVAAKQKIYDWYDTAKVEAAQPLYVPRQFLDIAQVQGVGYNIVVEDEIQTVFHFWRYLFYDAIDGKWVKPEERFLKIWLIA